MTMLSVVVLNATEIEFAPFGPAPLLNGLIGDSEWQYPDDYRVGFHSGLDKGLIMMKKDSSSLYLCIAPNDTLHTGLDLYIDNMAGEVFMLHISSAHGQRNLSDSGWGEMNWGPSEFWTSNLVQMIVENGERVIIAPEAFEFQIDRSLLPKKYFRFVIHLKRPELWSPENPDTLSSENWPEYDIDIR